MRRCCFLALGGEGFGLALGFHLGEMVADVGKFLEADDLHRHAGVGGFDGDAAVVDERADFAGERAADERGADLERAGLDDDGGGGAAAGNHAGLDDGGAGGGFRVGLEFEHLGLEGDEFEQGFHALAGDGGNLGELGVAAEVGGLQAVLGELGFHAVHVGGRQVALVDGDDDGLLRLFGVFDRLDAFAA